VLQSSASYVHRLPHRATIADRLQTLLLDMCHGHVWFMSRSDSSSIWQRLQDKVITLITTGYVSSRNDCPKKSMETVAARILQFT